MTEGEDDAKIDNGIKTEDIKTEDGAIEPITPKTKRTTAKLRVAIAKATTEDNADEDNGEPISPKAKKSPTKAKNSEDGTPRKRSAPASAIAPSRGIPTSWEEAGPADRMMVTMKEAGSDWNAIRATWATITGQKTASSTLPNR